MINHSPKNMYSTTIVCVRTDNQVVIAGDGQVTLGNQIIKSSARKVRFLAKNTVLTGFAGATADAFTLYERLEAKLEQYPSQLMRACVELAKDWRTDKYLRRLEAMMIVADKKTTLVLTGNGDVLEPEDPVVSIGSGSGFALASAKALVSLNQLTAEDIARRSLEIAGDLCIYTNKNIILESINL